MTLGMGKDEVRISGSVDKGMVVRGGPNGNMKMTTDFRRVYATAIKEWLGYDDTETILKGRFDPLHAFV